MISVYSSSVISPLGNSVDQLLKNLHSANNLFLHKNPDCYEFFRNGIPDFDFTNYREKIVKRRSESRFKQLNNASWNVKYTIAALIDALEGQPELEQTLLESDPKVYVSIGTCFGDITSIIQARTHYQTAELRWNEFWASPERNIKLKNHLNEICIDTNAPPRPCFKKEDQAEPIVEYLELYKEHNRYWTSQNDVLKAYLEELDEIESLKIQGNVDSNKLSIISKKIISKRKLNEKYGCPQPPWDCVSSDLLWNFPNMPAAQISMLLGIHGESNGLSGACASFLLALHNGIWAIESGEYDFAIVGACDNPPPPEIISAFYAGHVAAAGFQHSIPMTDLRGMHISGGSCIWVIGKNKPGEHAKTGENHIEILGVGISSDAEHIITPSKEGPLLAIKKAFEKANMSPSDVDVWDMHATGTPGDIAELQLLDQFLPKDVPLTARKGLLGHGMGVAAGWESTIAAFGVEKIQNQFLIPPSGIPSEKIHDFIKACGRKVIIDKPLLLTPRSSKGLIVGKLSLGIGGISGCLLCRIS